MISPASGHDRCGCDERLRFLFNKDENVNLRIDYGVGKDTSGVYFGLEEAF